MAAARVALLIALALLSSGLCLENADFMHETSATVCAKSGSIPQVNEEGTPVVEEYLADETTALCDSNNCYTFWAEDPDNGTIILSQGCWKSSGKPDCEDFLCTSNKRPTKDNTKFCCCSGNMCNANFSDIYDPSKETTVVPPATELLPKSAISPLIWIVLGVVFAFILAICGVCTYYCWRMKPKKNDIELGQHSIQPPADYRLDNLKFINIIGYGRYGTVWRGMVDEQEVAVKVFPAHHRNYFLNEHDVYQIAGEHNSLLRCFGGGERLMAPGGPADYLLILSLENECLQEYLKNNTLDLATLAKMSLAIAKGLAHLHSDVDKACIAHRDLNTRNILVREDLTCCICDLGLAVVPRSTENKALSEAGTLRYMSPEVLEGAVNLRDCESALKQIDVYALGLVIWELGSRCVDLQNSEPASYSPPFYKEVGDNPTLEQMQTLVSRRKARPLWPTSWKDTAAARLISETAEDCWDQDAEARLTSFCVEERLLDLPTLKGRVLHPMRPPVSPTPLINNNHLHDNNIDASVGTIETLLSPTEENCKNSNQLQACIPQLQPFQGRNPCMERNLLSGSSDSLLIDKSLKHCSGSGLGLGSESQNLISNDFLNFHSMNHRATPIPYLQNVVHSTGSGGAPKQLNNPLPMPAKNKFKWPRFKRLFHGRNENRVTKQRKTKEGHKDTQVRIVPGKLVNEVTTSLLHDNERENGEINNAKRPSTLPLTVKSVNTPTNPIPEGNLINTSSGVSQILKRENSLLRQRSLEQFSEVFSSTSDLSRLKDPSQRVKTPGDVPPSVRRTRGKAAKESSARFSLYDDRMMWGSAPDLDPHYNTINVNINHNNSSSKNDKQAHEQMHADRDSVSSF